MHNGGIPGGTAIAEAVFARSIVEDPMVRRFVEKED
jgi:hypothetical protein